MKIIFPTGYDRYINLLSLMTKSGKIPAQKSNRVTKPQIEKVICKSSGTNKTKGIK